MNNVTIHWFYSLSVLYMVCCLGLCPECVHGSFYLPHSLSLQFVFHFATLSLSLYYCSSNGISCVCVCGAVDLLFIAHTRTFTHILLPIVTRPKSSKVVNLINYWQTVIITVATKWKCACPEKRHITHARTLMVASPLMKIYYHIRWPCE